MNYSEGLTDTLPVFSSGVRVSLKYHIPAAISTTNIIKERMDFLLTPIPSQCR